MSGVGITGTGSYLPPDLVGNAPVEAAAGVETGWVERKTLIRTRHRALPEQATSDLAVEAARRALADAGLEPCQVGTIVVATSTPDSPQPPVASLVQQRLGVDGAAAFDVNAVCSGFVYALELARALVAAGSDGRSALVIGADVYSRVLDPTDRRTAVLFGDGAGAVVVGPVADGLGLGPAVLRGVGSASGLIGITAGGSRRPTSAQTVADGEHWFRMDGRGVRDFVADHVPGFLEEVLGASSWDRGAVDHVVPHQGNGVMLAGLREDLALPRARLHTTVETCGNTGSASVPITLDAANRSGALQRGDGVVLLGFGGGMNLAGTTCTWSGTRAGGSAGASVRALAPVRRTHAALPAPLRVAL